MADEPTEMPASGLASEEGGARAMASPRVRTALWLSTWALVFSGYLAMSTVRAVGVPILLFPMAMLLIAPIGERLDRRWRGYRAITRAATISYLCFIPMTVMSLGLTYAVVALIMFIQLIILVNRKDEREFLLLFLMSFFLLLAACVQSPEPGIALAMLLFLMSAIWAFLTLRLCVEEESSRTLSPPEILPIDALHPGPEGAGQSLFDRGLIGSVIGLSVMAMLLTAGVFVFVPRIEAGFFGRGQGETATTEIDEVVDLMGDEYLEEDDTPVMYVHFPELAPDKRPAANTLYWRSATMGQYESSRWTRASLRDFLDPRLIFPEVPPESTYSYGVPPGGASGYGSGTQGGPGGAGPPQGTYSGYGGGFGGGGFGGYSNPYSRVTFQNTPQEVTRRRREDTELIYYTVYMPEKPNTGVPALDLVYRMRILRGDGRTTVRWDRYQDYTLALRGRGDRQLDFEAWSELGDPDPDALDAVSGDPEKLWADNYQSFDYEVYTNHDLRESTQEFIRNLTENEESIYGKAMAIQDWLSGPDFEYTLELPPLPAVNTIDTFMLVARAGHCELFASAMALSLRSLGIPTRVVSGYHGAEVNESDGSYIVRRSMAHLWVESWIPEYGWVRFDPSPSSRILEISRLHQFSLFLSRYRLKAQMMWYREVVGFNSGIQVERLKEFTLAFFRSFSLPGEAEVGEDIESGGVHFPVGTVFFAALLVGLVVTVRRFKRRRHRPKWRLSEDQRRSVRLYQALRRRLRKCRLPAAGDTAGALLDNLTEAERAPVETVRALVQTYNEVRFGHRPLTRERYGRLMRQIRLLRPTGD